MKRRIYSTLNTEIVPEDHWYNLKPSKLKLGNDSLALLAAGVFPGNIYKLADTFNFDHQPTNQAALTPDVLIKNRNQSYTNVISLKYDAPEVETISFEDLCNYYIEHPRMVQFIVNKHNKLSRAFPLTSSFNLGHLSKDIFTLMSRLSKALTALLSDSNLIRHATEFLTSISPPPRAYDANSYISHVLTEYTCDCYHTITNFYTNVAYPVWSLMTISNLDSAKSNNCYYTGPLAFHGKRDLFGSARSTQQYYAHGYSNISFENIILNTCSTIATLEYLGSFGETIIPKIIDNISITRDYRVNATDLTPKTRLVFSLFLDKLLYAAKEFSEVANDLYNLILGKSEFASVLQDLDITPKTKLTELEYLVPIYLNGGYNSNITALSNHAVGDLLDLNSAVPSISSIMSSSEYSGGNPPSTAYMVLDKAINDLYGDIHSVGALAFRYVSSLGSNSRLTKIFNLIGGEYNATSRNIYSFNNLGNEVWNVVNNYKLPSYALAHIELIFLTRNLLFNMGNVHMRGVFHNNALRRLVSPAFRDTHSPFMVGRILNSTFYDSTRKNPRVWEPNVRPDATTIRNIPNSNGGLYVRDFKDKKSAQGFKEIKFKR